MPKGFKATKPKLDIINPDTLHDDIMSCVYDQLSILGYNSKGVDNSNEKKPRYISHNEINYILRQVYNTLFKPSGTLYNNQKSIVDYDNVVLLQILGDTFIDICTLYNKSLGLMSFAFMIGCDYKTVYNWMHDERSNPKRLQVLKNIQEMHKTIHVGLLNESPVGAMAAANNDHETGLNWAANQAQQITNNTVYYIPSERVERLKLETSNE